MIRLAGFVVRQCSRDYQLLVTARLDYSVLLHRFNGALNGKNTQFCSITAGGTMARRHLARVCTFGICQQKLQLITVMPTDTWDRPACTHNSLRAIQRHCWTGPTGPWNCSDCAAGHTSEAHNLDTMIAVPCGEHLNAQTRLQRYNSCS
jgi:hypothetical protein